MADAALQGHRHINPFVIFGIAIFGVLTFYLSLVVVTQVDEILFPGNELNLGIGVIPGVDSGETPESADIEQRINILFMGLDQRRDESPDTPARTDSVIILTMDPFSKTGGAFSIPRDSLVDIPDGYGGYYRDRINVVYEYGEYNYDNYPGGGFGLIRDSIEHTFNIPIDHYVVLNFNNFIELIDELGGIEVDVPDYAYDSAYNDCNGCPYYPVEFIEGLEHMDGERALAYARIRASDNDFKRIERQQMVIQATARKALDLGTVLSNPLDLYNKYKDSVKTDINNLKIPGLALLAKQIGADNLRLVSMARATFPCQYDCSAGAVLDWDPDIVEELKALVFSDGKLQSDNAIVEVLNGTPTPDLAAQFATFLRSQGLTSAQVSIDEYADGELYNSTIILNLGGKEYTTSKLAEWLNLPPTRIKTSLDPEALPFAGRTATVIVVLGSDASLPDGDAANAALEEATAGG